MAVIVEDCRAVVSADEGHAAIDAGEVVEGVDAGGQVRAGGVTCCKSHGGVDQVVLAGDGKREDADGVGIVEDRAFVAAVFGAENFGVPVGGGFGEGAELDARGNFLQRLIHAAMSSITSLATWPALPYSSGLLLPLPSMNRWFGAGSDRA